MPLDLEKLILVSLKRDRGLSRKIQHYFAVNHFAACFDPDYRLQRHTILQSNRWHLHSLLLILTIERDDERLAPMLAREDVTLIVRKKIDRATDSHRCIYAPKLNPLARPLEH